MFVLIAAGFRADAKDAWDVLYGTFDPLSPDHVQQVIEAARKLDSERYQGGTDCQTMKARLNDRRGASRAPKRKKPVSEEVHLCP
mmetsp:Transcript_66827/g.164743  ORF Transcript_66827/g.164743 Transcript_66827/m.164743 type:complete len:85 (+) Transcript_66827:333-587(+)